MLVRKALLLIVFIPLAGAHINVLTAAAEWVVLWVLKKNRQQSVCCWLVINTRAAGGSTNIGHSWATCLFKFWWKKTASSCIADLLILLAWARLNGISEADGALVPSRPTRANILTLLPSTTSTIPHIHHILVTTLLLARAHTLPYQSCVADCYNISTYYSREHYCCKTFPPNGVVSIAPFLTLCGKRQTCDVHFHCIISIAIKKKNTCVCTVHIKPFFLCTGRHPAHPVSTLILHPREIREYKLCGHKSTT